MKSVSILLAALAALAPANLSAAVEDKVKVGLIVTLSGPPAVLGGQVRDGFNLAVKTLSRDS
jgi:branched-chain amino acid transport system substrate-binding protein